MSSRRARSAPPARELEECQDFRDGLEVEREALGRPSRSKSRWATAVKKITLSSSRDIPFNKLILSQTNIRTRKDGVSIEELAASITRRGLIQSLHVRPVLDAEGIEARMFDVPAGGRRYRALELLVKQKRLAQGCACAVWTRYSARRRSLCTESRISQSQAA